MKILVIGAMILTLSGCQTMGGKETLGTLGGAAMGGLVGSQFGSGSGKAVATTAGVFLGGMAGREIGAQMDAADKRLMSNTFQRSLESTPNGTVLPWTNNNTGNSGHILPTRTGQDRTGRYCREYRNRVRVAGSVQDSFGTACRTPDGQWEVQ
jgi:surface antigen